MSRSDFRIKVDLSKYYQDIRRFCWVFIDGTKVSEISHIKEHITKLFNIREPYHLCLNDADYLPPNEDARILKENETILVIPGSGLGDEAESSLTSTSQFVKDNNHGNSRISKMYYHKEAQTIEFPTAKVAVATRDMNTQSNGFSSDSKQDLSSMDVTFHSIVNDTEGDSGTDSKTMDSTITEDCSITQNKVTETKRKRVRHRKGKKNTQQFKESVMNESNAMKKPKIIDSLVISSGKHIRFDASEDKDTETSKQIRNDVSVDDQFTMKSPCNTLSTLLGLRHSSTPLTFMNNKVKEENIKSESTSDVEDENTDVSSNKTKDTLKNAVDKNTSDKENNYKFKNQTFSDAELEGYPLVKTDAENNDIIVFKMLNFGEDYSPQVSKPIVGQVVSFLPQTNTFTLKILKGLDQVHNGSIPSGKFSIPEGENETIISDTLNIKIGQMIEPRFIKKSSGNPNSFC